MGDFNLVFFPVLGTESAILPCGMARATGISEVPITRLRKSPAPELLRGCLFVLPEKVQGPF